MRKRTLPKQSDGIHSPFLIALNNRRQLLHHLTHDLAHPVSAHQNLYGELEKALGKLLVSLNEIDGELALGPSTTNSTRRDACEQFRDVIYRAAELFELYEKGIPRSINAPTENLYQKRVKSNRSFWANICNKLKHNHQELWPVSAKYSFCGYAIGFSLMKHTSDGVIGPNPDIHQSAQALSFNRALPRLVADLLDCDEAAADLTTTTAETQSATTVSIANPTFFTGGLLGLLAARPEWGMPDEGDGPAVFMTEETEAYVLEQRITRMPSIGDARVSLAVKVDPNAPSITVPGLRRTDGPIT